MTNQRGIYSRMAGEFKEKIHNAQFREGQPGILGKEDGTIYYTDPGATTHNNWVWVRMGQDNQVLAIAKSEKKGLPEVAGLEVTVATRFGMLYIADWDRDDPDVPSAGGGGGSIPAVTFTAADELSYANPVILYGADHNSGIASTPTHLAALSSTLFVVAFQDDTPTYLGKAVALTVDGSNSITWGTPVQFYGGQIDEWHVVALDSSTIVISYRVNGTDDVYVIAGTISGTTITFGTAVSTSTQMSETDPLRYHHLTKRNSSSVLLAYTTEGATDYVKVAQVAISGTTVGAFSAAGSHSAGFTHDNPAIGSPGENHHIVFYRTPKGFPGFTGTILINWFSHAYSGGSWGALSDERIIYSGSSYYSRTNRNHIHGGAVCTDRVAFTFAFDVGAAENIMIGLAQLNAGSDGTIPGNYVQVGVNGIYPRVSPFDADKFIVCWHDRYNHHTWVALVEAHGGQPVPTTTTLMYTSADGSGTTIMYHPMAAPIDSTRFLVVCRRYNSGSSPASALAAFVGTIA